MMEISFSVVFFIFGLIIGSFLNVVIYRLNTQRSLGGRSACMSCRNKLAWYELIPLFSYLGLGGRCRNCKTKISIQYPLVELLTGFIFASLFVKYQGIFFTDKFSFFITYDYYAILFSILLVIAVYDIKHKIIPDMLALIFGILAFVGLFFFTNNIFYPHMPSLLEFLSGVFIASPFALFWLISRGRWMGFGDAKLAIGLGWFLGLSLTLSGLAIAFWSGAIVGVVLIIFSKYGKAGKMGMKSEIPFAPFLVAGAFTAFIFGLNLFNF
ncbi:MAG: prepilin peptidase [Patescibacteria group bacterium]